MAHSFQQSIVSLLQPHSIPIPVSALLGNTAASILQHGRGQSTVHGSRVTRDPHTADFFLLTSPWHVLHKNKWGSNLSKDESRDRLDPSNCCTGCWILARQINPQEHHLCKHAMFTSTKDTDETKNLQTKSGHFSEAPWWCREWRLTACYTTQKLCWISPRAILDPAQFYDILLLRTCNCIPEIRPSNPPKIYQHYDYSKIKSKLLIHSRSGWIEGEGWAACK